MKPVFLSASEPNPNRSPEYWDSGKLLAVREAIRAVVAYVLQRQPLVFGGHPAITPLVRAMAGRVRHDGAEPRILLFLSQHFRDRFPDNVAQFSDTILIDAVDSSGSLTAPNGGDRAMSLALMRYSMLGRPEIQSPISELARFQTQFGWDRYERFGTMEFAAAVFIGGMEGVEREFNIFRHFHPNTPAWPIASTGRACARLLERVNLPDRIVATLTEQPVYSLLAERLLGDLVDHPWPSRMRPFARDEHLDPPGLD